MLARSLALVILAAAVAPAIAAHKLTAGDWELTVSEDGGLISLADGHGRAFSIDPHQQYVTLYPSKLMSSMCVPLLCNKPNSVRTIENGLAFEYSETAHVPLRVRNEIVFEKIGGWPTICRRVTLTPVNPPFKDALRFSIGGLFVAEPVPRILAPLIDGRMEEFNAKGRFPRFCSYKLTSVGRADDESSRHLAIPMVTTSDAANTLRITHVADPLSDAGFSFSFPPSGPVWLSGSCAAVAFELTKDKRVPLAEPVTRTFWTVIHDGPPERAMDAWYATALADVPAGPAWLHEVAMQDYDYLSHGGKGWFEDIDMAEKLIAPADRAKVVFTLHGWYDMLGRYTFDAKTGKLDEEWTAFPNAPAVKDRFPTSESVKMNKAEMHRRIRYAKDRGFRVCLYFADGLTACEGAGLFAEDKLINWGGWVGPDTVGKPYLQNPDHPAVYKWYLDYHQALLNEYGKEIDALVWDETFMIRAGAVAPAGAPRPAYLAPVFMRLVRDLTQATTRFNKNLAFLTSDCQGATFDEKARWLDVPPYAIMAHGTYQDSHSRPSVWPYGIFANYRNVLWSCNWQAVTHFDYTRFGVEHYGTPVAVTNGWLDDKGLARLGESQRVAVMELFNQRKDRPQQLKWLTGPAPVFEAK